MGHFCIQYKVQNHMSENENIAVMIKALKNIALLYTTGSIAKNWSETKRELCAFEAFMIASELSVSGNNTVADTLRRAQIVIDIAKENK